MMADPYNVLGINRNASDDEVKRAYRDLSRKYHPDMNANNPLAELAEEKFKEVQSAYEQIIKEREQGPGQYQNGYGQGGWNQNNAYGDDWQKDSKLVAAANYINSRHYYEALNVLDGMSDRIGQWYYLAALAHSGLGNNIEALNNARTAAQMEPNNRAFADLVNRLQFGRNRYQSGGTGYGAGGSTCGTGNLCCDLWCADSLCECMGGDICSCM